MPRQYEAIRDRLIQHGVPRKEAEAHAAAIYNSTHKKNPVGRNSDKKSKKS